MYHTLTNFDMHDLMVEHSMVASMSMSGAHDDSDFSSSSLRVSYVFYVKEWARQCHIWALCTRKYYYNDIILPPIH